MPMTTSGSWGRDHRTAGKRAGVVIRFVSCDSNRIVPDTLPVHRSRTFVGTQGYEADPRCLSRYRGSLNGIAADRGLSQIISFLR